MYELTEIAGWIAGVLGFLAIIPYARSILARKTTPNRATWLIWTIVGVMLGSSYYAGGASHTMWLPISYVVGPFIVLLLSIKYGEGGWSKLDRACLLIAGASVVAWLMTGSPIVALCVNLVADAMGASPTVLKAYRRPESEDRLAWGIVLLATCFNVAAIGDWGSFSIWLYPVYMFSMAGLVNVLLLTRAPESSSSF